MPLYREGGKDKDSEPVLVPDGEDHAARLNALGAEGWEVVSSIGLGGIRGYAGPKMLHVVLKRPA